MRAKIIIGLVVIVAFSIFALYSFKSSLTPYVTFAKAAETSNTVQVLGHLKGEEISYDLNSNQLHFYLEDEEGTQVPVRYKGVKPSNMEHADNIVVIGVLEGDVFMAERLLVKCPSKYEKDN